ncbi:MAG TPA: Ig-like domain-containing protein, partial [Geminicoccaceae bacterium]|nr:Ig-like domain-containing protein [Geminicoccaceae bacterium]
NDVAFLPNGVPVRAAAPDLEIVSFEQPGNGTVVLNPDGTFTYTPYESFNGVDSWTYQIRNADGLTDTATVRIEVTPVNDPPVIRGTPDPSAAITEVSSGQDYGSAVPLGDVPPSRPPLSDAEINGVDQGNLVLNGARDAEIIFVDEYATFVNTLGVYLIGADGTIQNPKIVFPAVDHAEPLLDAAGNPIPGDTDRPGGGPLSPGDSVSLSDLYSPAELQPGVRFGLFVVQEGQSRNPGIDFESGSFRFVNAGGATAKITDTAPSLIHTAPSGAQVQVQGGIFHTADPTAGSPLSNPLNTGGGGQLISGLQPGAPGLTVVYEDIALGGGADRDFNDPLFRIRIPASIEVNLVPRPVPLVPDLTLSDVDNAEMRGATVEIAAGRQPGDVLGFADGITVGPGGFIAGTNIRVVADGGDGVLQLQGRAPIADYQGVLRSITYDSASPAGGDRQFTFRVEDADGEVSDPFTVTLGIPVPVIGGPGGETLAGTDGPDVLLGRGGDDTLTGGGGDDALAGGPGADALFGGAGDDFLDGGDGDDRLLGGAGDDVLRGGPGADVLEGGAGADGHVYSSLDDRGDRIIGFAAGDGDRLVVTELLRGFDPATSSVGDFVSLSGPVGGDRVLSVDVDGAGAAFQPIAIATLVQPVGVTTVQEMFDSGSLVA